MEKARYTAEKEMISYAILLKQLDLWWQGNDKIEAIDAGGTIKGGKGNDEIRARGEAVYTVYGDRGDDRIIIELIFQTLHSVVLATII